MADRRERPRWSSRFGQAEWVQNLMVHQGKLFDWLLESVLGELSQIRNRMETVVSSIADIAAQDQQLADSVTTLVTGIDRLDQDLQNLKTAANQLPADQQALLDQAFAQSQTTLDTLKAAGAKIDTDDPAPGTDPGTGDGSTDTGSGDTGTLPDPTTPVDDTPTA